MSWHNFWRTIQGKPISTMTKKVKDETTYKYDYRITRESTLPPHSPHGPTYEYVLEHIEYLERIQKEHPLYAHRVMAHNLLNSLFDLKQKEQGAVGKKLKNDRKEIFGGDI